MSRVVSTIDENQFYGDRTGQIKDPFGYTWIVATRQQDVSVTDMQKGFDEFLSKHDSKEIKSED